ncbi:MAG: peptide ABC transporter substrate-binding protein [Clostridia bacterium]|nr:peptide ABC transporter substrate-binding protein [Clostridia bacterium]
MKFKWFIPILIIMLVFSGCSSNTLKPVAPTATPTPLIDEWLRANTTVTVSVPSVIESTNPFFVTKKDVLDIYNLIYEPLVKLDESNEPTPYLAKSWISDEEGKTWTFILRDGVYWQGTNREINAQDVIFTLDMMKEIREQSIHCKVMGYLRSWRRVDDRTFEITTYEPFYGFLMGMDFPILPYDAGFTSGVSQPSIPIGTGPFYVTDFRPGIRIELQANEKWWKTLPEVTTIVGEIYDDPSLALSALTLGQIDLLATDDLAVTQIREDGAANAFEYTTNYYEFLIPNMDGNIALRDKKVRQAIALGLNRQEIISNVYVNHAIITEAPIQPSSWLYVGTVNGYEQDIEEAKRLLTLAGWKKENPEDQYFNISPDGIHTDFTLDLLTNSSEFNSLRYESAVIISKQLADIGIKVNIRTVEWDTFNNRISEGYYDLLLAGWYVDEIPDYRKLYTLDGDYNLSGYSSDEMDTILDEIMQQSTRDGLKASFRKFQTLLVEDVPVISLYFRTNTLLTRAGIVNVTDIKDANAYNSIADWNLLE